MQHTSSLQQAVPQIARYHNNQSSHSWLSAKKHQGKAPHLTPTDAGVQKAMLRALRRERQHTEPCKIEFKLPNSPRHLDSIVVTESLDSRLRKCIGQGLETLKQIWSDKAICEQRKQDLELINWLKTTIKCLTQAPNVPYTKEQIFEYLRNIYNSCISELVRRIRVWSKQKAATLQLVWRNLLALYEWLEQYYRESMCSEATGYLVKTQRQMRKNLEEVEQLKAQIEQLRRSKEQKEAYFYQIVKDNRVLRNRNNKLVARLKHEMDGNHTLKQENLSYYKQNQKMRMVLSGEEDLEGQYNQLLRKCNKIEKEFVNNPSLAKNSVMHQIKQAEVATKVGFVDEIKYIMKKIDEQDLLDLEYFELPHEAKECTHFSCSVQTQSDTQNVAVNTPDFWKSKKHVQTQANIQPIKKPLSILMAYNIKIVAEPGITRKASAAEIISSRRSSRASRQSILILSKGKLPNALPSPSVLHTVPEREPEQKTYQDRLYRIQLLYDSLMRTMESLKISQIAVPNYQKPRLKKDIMPIVTNFILEANKLAHLSGRHNSQKHRESVAVVTEPPISPAQSAAGKTRKASIDNLISVGQLGRKSSIFSTTSASKLRERLQRRISTEPFDSSPTARNTDITFKSASSNQRHSGQLPETIPQKQAEVLPQQLQPELEANVPSLAFKQNQEPVTQRTTKAGTKPLQKISKKQLNTNNKQKPVTTATHRTSINEVQSNTKLPKALPPRAFLPRYSLVPSNFFLDEKQTLETIRQLLTSKQIQSFEQKSTFQNLEQPSCQQPQSTRKSAQNNDQKPYLTKETDRKRTSLNSNCEDFKITTNFENKQELFKFFKKARTSLQQSRPSMRLQSPSNTLNHRQSKNEHPQLARQTPPNPAANSQKRKPVRNESVLTKTDKNPALIKELLTASKSELPLDIEELFSRINEIQWEVELPVAETSRSRASTNYPLVTVQKFIKFINKQILKHSQSLLNNEGTFGQFFQKRVVYRYGLEDMAANFQTKFKASLQSYSSDTYAAKVICRLYGLGSEGAGLTNYYLRDLLKVYVLTLELASSEGLDQNLWVKKETALKRLTELLEVLVNPKQLESFCTSISLTETLVDKRVCISMFQLFYKADTLLQSLSQSTQLSRVISCLDQIFSSSLFVSVHQLVSLATIAQEDRNLLHMNLLKLVQHFQPIGAGEDIQSLGKLANRNQKILPVSRLVLLSNRLGWEAIVNPVQSINKRFQKYFGANFDPDLICGDWDHQFSVLKSQCTKSQRLLELLNNKIQEYGLQNQNHKEFPELLYKITRVSISNDLQTKLQNQLLDERLLMFPACLLKLECLRISTSISS